MVAFFCCGVEKINIAAKVLRSEVDGSYAVVTLWSLILMRQYMYLALQVAAHVVLDEGPPGRAGF